MREPYDYRGLRGGNGKSEQGWQELFGLKMRWTLIVLRAGRKGSAVDPGPFAAGMKSINWNNLPYPVENGGSSRIPHQFERI